MTIGPTFSRFGQSQLGLIDPLLVEQSVVGMSIQELTETDLRLVAQTA